MGYTPKHAKPAALNSSTAANRRHAIAALSGRRGRHAAPANVVRASEGTAASGLRAA